MRGRLGTCTRAHAHLGTQHNYFLLASLTATSTQTTSSYLSLFLLHLLAPLSYTFHVSRSTMAATTPTRPHWAYIGPASVVSPLVGLQSVCIPHHNQAPSSRLSQSRTYTSAPSTSQRSTVQTAPFNIEPPLAPTSSSTTTPCELERALPKQATGPLRSVQCLSDPSARHDLQDGRNTLLS